MQDQPRAMCAQKPISCGSTLCNTQAVGNMPNAKGNKPLLPTDGAGFGSGGVHHCEPRMVLLTCGACMLQRARKVALYRCVPLRPQLRGTGAASRDCTT